MKKSSRPKPTGHTFDSVLEALPADKRRALQRLRKTIKAAAPAAEECISYGIPAFRLNGKFLVGLGAGANHCSFYPGSALKNLQADLRRYETGKGTIRFSADHPLPPALVKKIVKARIKKMSVSPRR